MPAVCSWLAAVISPMMSVTRLHAVDDLFHRARRPRPPACCPPRPCSTESSIRVLISLAAAAERCARLRTSEATTAKPRPCSPARAASTAAFSARMLVWKAMPSITPMMSTILRDDALIEPMVSTTCADHAAALAPPLPRPTTASWLAWRALSAFCLTVEVSSSIEAAVSSSELACCSVRDDRSRLPVAICALAVDTFATTPCTCCSDACRAVRMPSIARSSRPVSSLA